MTFFTRVQEVFEINGHGTVLVLPKEWGSDVRIRIGDNIQLRTPEGKVFDTRIHGVELVKTTDKGCVGAITLPGEISSSDIPKLTEIWLTETS